jgi:hypothetical protein
VEVLGDNLLDHSRSGLAQVEPNVVAHSKASLLRLLDSYGAAELRCAIQEALERHTPRASSVAFILNRRQRSQKNATPVPVDLSRHPEMQSLEITPHNLESYDELTDKKHEPDE